MGKLSRRKITDELCGNLKHELGCVRRKERRAGDGFNLLDWGRHYLPAHFAKPASPMHRWLAARLHEMQFTRRTGFQPVREEAIPKTGCQPVPPTGQKINLLAPRGGAKSTLVTLTYILRAALEGSEPYIWIISDTKHQACAHLENLKTELTENRRLANDYPQAVGKGPAWRSNSIVLRNGVTIEAFGTGQRIRGRRRREHRPTLIVCDDLQNDGHIRSAVQRDHSRQWFHGMLMKAGTPQTHVVNLATALHRDALAMELHRTPGWTSRIFKAVVRWPKNMSLWAEWEAIYTKISDCKLVIANCKLQNEQQRIPAIKPPPMATGPSVSSHLSGHHTNKPISDYSKLNNGAVTPSSNLQFAICNDQLAIPHSPISAARTFYENHRAAMDAGAIVLWPEVEDLYTLMCMRAEGGRTAFEREKQNAPLNPDLCEWPEEYFDESIWFDDWPQKLSVKTMALDPSKGSDSRRGDYSALVRLGMDRRGIVYVEADLARRPTPQIVADGVEAYCQFQPDVFGVEANQFQDLLAGEFEAEFRRRGLLAARPYPMENTVNKLVRIRRLGPYLSTRRLRFKSGSPGTQMLVAQLQEFPAGDHDDGPDAAEMALRLAAELLRGRAVRDGLGNRLPVG